MHVTCIILLILEPDLCLLLKYGYFSQRQMEVILTLPNIVSDLAVFALSSQDLSVCQFTVFAVISTPALISAPPNKNILKLQTSISRQRKIVETSFKNW